MTFSFNSIFILLSLMGEKPRTKVMGLQSAQTGVFHKEKPIQAHENLRFEPVIPWLKRRGFPGFSRNKFTDTTLAPAHQETLCVWAGSRVERLLR